jgi:4-hydroxy-tetrahydrodipicolinate synthase
MEVTMPVEFAPTGVVPACLLPFDRDEAIDETCLRAHLRALAEVEGVTGITVNGHASEVHACTFDEQQRITEIALEEAGDSVPIICGIYADSSRQASALAKAAERAGAHALLVFPPNVLMFGGNLRPELGTDYVRDIAAASSLPIIVFQFPAWTNMQYGLDALVGLCEDVETVVAIKDLCTDPRLHEIHIRALHGLTRPVNVMTTHSMWLAGSLAMGARGIISGAGSVIADRQAALFAAAQSKDGQAFSAWSEEMHILVEALYGAPYANWPARMKEVLFRFGRMATPTVRRPLQPIGEGDWNRMAALMRSIGFTAEALYCGGLTDATRRNEPAILRHTG